MKTDSTLLLKQLHDIAQKDLKNLKMLKDISVSVLENKPAPGSWSALQCLAHLNLYSAFYLPRLKETFVQAGHAQKAFKSSFMGNMLVNMVIPKDKGKKMKTFAAMEPAAKTNLQDLEVCIKNQEKLVGMLKQAASLNLNHKAVPVTFNKFIKLRVGDALRFMVYHNCRHIAQALRAL